MAVTGANKGIGYEIARRLLADHPDATVLVTARNEVRCCGGICVRGGGQRAP